MGRNQKYSKKLSCWESTNTKKGKTINESLGVEEFDHRTRQSYSKELKKEIIDAYLEGTFHF